MPATHKSYQASTKTTKHKRLFLIHRQSLSSSSASPRVLESKGTHNINGIVYSLNPSYILPSNSTILRDHWVWNGKLHATNYTAFMLVCCQWRNMYRFLLTLTLLMSCIYGAPTKVRNLTLYIYLDDIFTGDFASWTVHFVNICVKTNKYTNY
jgi:hypothetical protein